MRRAACRRRQRGLTLVELIVALAVLGLLMGGLAAALGLGTRTTDTVERRIGAAESVRVAHAELRRMLAQARPVRWTMDRRTTVAFDGGPEQVSFVMAAPSVASGGGIYLVRLAVESTPQGRALVAIRRPTAGDAPGFAFAQGDERTVLLHGINELRWSFLGVDPRAQRLAWFTEWTAETALPRLVRLDLQFRDPGAPAWPPLEVVPLIEADPR